MDATISAGARFLLPVGGASILAGLGIAAGLVLLVVPGLILMTYWSLIVPSIVVGESGAMASFGKRCGPSAVTSGRRSAPTCWSS